MTHILLDQPSGFIRSHPGRLACLFVIALVVCGAGLGWSAMAQSDAGPWTTPVNISKSGAASQPVIAAAPDGGLHALWWDSAEGEQYAWTTSLTGTTWTTPTTVSQIFGERKIETNADTGKSTVTLKPPLEVRLLSGLRGDTHAFWLDQEGQLFDARTVGAAWGSAVVLADSALVVDVAGDVQGTLHVAYLRGDNSPGNPSGVYYRATSNGAVWSGPALVYASLYFRSVKPEQANVSVASDGQGQVVAAWDDVQAGQSLYAHSPDGGRTWSTPQTISTDPSQQIVRARVVSSQTGDFFLLWQDETTATCRLSLRRSTDGGQTWSAPERIPAGTSRCPGRWRFASGGDGRLWLVGVPASSALDTSGSSVTLIAWDGKAWSRAADVSMGLQSTTQDKGASLRGLDLALAGQSVGIVGVDAEGDVWAARNAVGLELLMPALKPVWDQAVSVSDPQSLTHVNEVPALVADEQGKLYTFWSESSDPAGPGTALYMAIWDGSRWSRATRMFQPRVTGTGLSAGATSVGLSEQPSLAIDRDGRLHAVWRGEQEGAVLYSSSFARDAASSQAWAGPTTLPMPGRLGAWPDIEADPRSNTLHVLYAVPYNEGRGIHYVRSNDGGTSWLTSTVVFDAVAAKWDSVDKPHLALDARANVLHAVWLRTALIGEARGRAVMYARSTDDGRTWSAPQKVAEGVLDWPRLATAEAGQVHLVWNRTKSAAGASTTFSEVWAQSSFDGGQRWSEPRQVPGFEDVTGPVCVASDGAGGLYVVGVGRGTSGEARLLYSRWDGLAWTGHEHFGLGQDATPGNAVVAVLVPTVGRLSALLREFVSAPGGAGQFRLIATGRDVPVAPTPRPIPTYTPLPTVTPMATSMPAPTETARPSLNSTGMPQGVSRSPLPISTSLVAGGVVVALLILVVVVSQVAWTARR